MEETGAHPWGEEQRKRVDRELSFAPMAAVTRKVRETGKVRRMRKNERKGREKEL